MKEYAIIKGQERVKQAVAMLISRSCWFDVTPQPDDSWCVTTKDEGHLEAIGVKPNGKINV